MRARAVAFGLLLAAACGSGPTGGGSFAAGGAQAFYGMADGEVAFVVLRAPWAFTGESMSAGTQGPGADRVAVSWFATDGATVRLGFAPGRSGGGTVSLDGVQFDLADGNVFALRRSRGRTGAQVLARRELVRDSLEESVAELLRDHPEVGEYLGLDRPPPVVVSVAGRAGEGPASAYAVEIANAGERTVAGVAFRIFELDGAGRRVGPEGRKVALEYPPGRRLEPGGTRKDSVPRDPGAANALILLTRVLFAEGHPPVWLAD